MVKLTKEEIEQISKETHYPKWVCKLLAWAMQPYIEEAIDKIVMEQEEVNARQDEFDEMHRKAHENDKQGH